MLAKRIAARNALRQKPAPTAHPTAPPTLVFAWSQIVDNRQQTTTNGFWGLGDTLRGILTLYQYCKRNRYEFIVDTHRHPFSKFLKENTSLYHRIADGKNITFEGVDGGPFLSLKLNVKNGDTRHIICNAHPEEPLLSDEKWLIRTLLQVKSEYQLALPTQPYSVLHIRVGDTAINGLISAVQLATYIDLVNQYLVAGDVVCSDSVQLKRHIMTVNPTIKVYVNDRRSGHVGYDTEPDLLRNTLDDLQIVLGATRVFTYSNYVWVSGFVVWGCKCFNIPLVDVKNEKVSLLELSLYKVRPADKSSGKFNLIISLYTEKNNSRAKELLYCLLKNLENPLISHIHIMYEKTNDSSLLETYLPILSKTIPYIHIIHITSKPSFSFIFNYCNTNIRGPVIISNSDILFDSTLGKIEDLNDRFICLTRYNQLNEKKWHPISYLNGTINLHSQDTWIFDSPMKYTFTINDDIKLGDMFCDSIINYYLSKLEYKCYNIFNDVHTFHIQVGPSISQMFFKNAAESDIYFKKYLSIFGEEYRYALLPSSITNYVDGTTASMFTFNTDSKAIESYKGTIIPHNYDVSQLYTTTQLSFSDILLQSIYK